MFDRVGYDVKHDIWGVSNSEYRCSINAISGELHILETKEEYSGADNITIIDFMELNDVIRDNPESYYEKARAMVEANLADGRNIEDMFIDGIQVVFTNGDQPQTIQVDCRVLMESGRSYSLSFTGSELYVTSFYSHPTQHAAVFGYWWEEEASEYPKDWHVPN